MTGAVVLNEVKDPYMASGGVEGEPEHSAAPRSTLRYRPFFAFIFAYTAVGRPYRVMKPSAQVWS